MKKEQKAETLFRGITNISDAVINEAASGALPAKRATATMQRWTNTA